MFIQFSQQIDKNTQLFKFNRKIRFCLNFFFMAIIEPAYSYLAWMDRVHHPARGLESSLVRFSDSAQLYVMKENVLRNISGSLSLMETDMQEEATVQTIF